MVSQQTSIIGFVVLGLTFLLLALAAPFDTIRAAGIGGVVFCALSIALEIY